MIIVDNCDKTIIHEGRWTYECQDFTGDLKKYDEISITWRKNGPFLQWGLQATSPATSPNNVIDVQMTSPDSVCIDQDAVAFDVPGKEHQGLDGSSA